MQKIIKSEEKRLEICNLAYESFIENGVLEFSLNKFIRNLNMSKGQFYHYFKSKEELIFATVEIKSFEYINIIKKNILKKNDFLEKLFEYFAFYINEKDKIFIDSRKIIFETMHLYLNPKYKNEMKIYANIYSNMLQIIEEIFDEAIKNKIIKKNSKELIKYIFATTDGLYSHSLIFDNYNLKDSVTEYLTNLFSQIKI